jgi:hypothetical protein
MLFVCLDLWFMRRLYYYTIVSRKTHGIHHHFCGGCVLLFFVYFKTFSFFLSLIHPLVSTVATYKNQRQGIGLCHIGLKKDSLVMFAIGTLGILTSGQGWIIGNGTRYIVQYISHFLFQIIAINQWLIRCCFSIPTQTTGIQ